MGGSFDGFFWLGSSLLGILILILKSEDKTRGMILGIITVFPAILGGPIFLFCALIQNRNETCLSRKTVKPNEANAKSVSTK